MYACVNYRCVPGAKANGRPTGTGAYFRGVREGVVDKTQDGSDSDNEQEVQLAIDVGSVNI